MKWTATFYFTNGEDQDLKIKKQFVVLKIIVKIGIAFIQNYVDCHIEKWWR